MPTQTANSGIVVDANSGERHIPESVRADGSTRRAIKVKPGYRPPEDVEVYKNRTAESFRERGKRIGIPGASGIKDEDTEPSASAASNKNAKRREARKKAKAAAEDGTDGNVTQGKGQSDVNGEEPVQVDPEVEKEKRARNLKKKLKQARELKNKKDDGQTLLPEQIAKVIKINELIRELDALGFQEDGEAQAAPASKDQPSTETGT